MYYRAPENRLSDVCEEARALFAALQAVRQSSGCQALSPALLRRPELRDGDITFMEVYGPLASGSLPALAEQISALLPRFPLLGAAQRHTEKFTELPCA